MLAIDKYAYINKLRYFNDDVKLWFFIVMISISLFTSNPFIHLAIFLIMGIIVVKIAKIPLRVYLKIYLIPISFILLSIVAFVFSISDTDRASLFAIKVSNFFIVVREDSLLKAMTLTSRAIASISCSYFLILTTPFNSLIKLLLKYKVPALLIELTMLTYRFIFILLEEISSIYRAQDLKFGYNNIRNSFNSLGLLLRSVIVRLFKRYQDMIVSLESKNYDNKFHM